MQIPGNPSSVRNISPDQQDHPSFFWQCRFVEAGYMSKKGAREYNPVRRSRPEVSVSTLFCCQFLLTRIVSYSPFLRLFLQLRWSIRCSKRLRRTTFPRLCLNQYVLLSSQQPPSHCSDRKYSKILTSLENQWNSLRPRMIPSTSSVYPRRCLWK